MSAALSVAECVVVEEHSKCSIRLDYVWETVRKDIIQFIVGSVKIFSDKTRISLKADGLAFYPPHKAHLSCIEEMKRHQVLSGTKFLASLLISFHIDSSQQQKLKPMPIGSLRMDFLQSLRKSSAKCLAAFLKYTF